jgi:hypothetical protein
MGGKRWEWRMSERWEWWMSERWEVKDGSGG